MLTPDRILVEAGKPVALHLDSLAEHDSMPLTAYTYAAPLTAERAERARVAIENELAAGVALSALLSGEHTTPEQLDEQLDDAREQLAEVVAEQVGEMVPIDDEVVVLCWN